ncbi:MAG: response regulator [Dokdonella sp.]|uniref:response regulator n=1 Tax=Dokdonella sp. TaxID=2291710 RepID=UPI002C9A9607|nr:response regulator [Dokdonella sp.]HQW76122.1 response regulator [Dokdonella sp.]HQX65907.1 response regulator [Dokdonella sp.]HQY55428.1 response regulator [Dokdonella sp.]
MNSLAMDAALRVLLVEDDANDAELLLERLRDDGLAIEARQVETEDDFREALGQFEPDIVISDLNMPMFNGYRALEILRERARLVPFIFVSGTMGEDAAVMALRAGAIDYLLKERLARLPSAVTRAVQEARAALARERSEQELMRAQRFESLAMLAGGLSHDLRNILQPLLLAADAMKEHEDERLRKHGALVGDCAKRGLEMVASMLSFARGARLETERVKLAALFDAMLMLLRGSVPRNIEMVIEKPADDLAIEGNHTELQQCLLNLCLNALQAMPDGGRLRLSAEPSAVDADFFADDELQAPGAYLKLQVSDTGIGMPEHVRDNLFRPFFTTKETGTGLGLVSCKRIVSNHRGYLRVLSESNKGTTFEVYLPLRGVESDNDDTPIEVGQGEHVLVIVEKLGKQTMLTDTLELNGYAVTTADSGSQAVQKIQALGMPDIVVMDADLRLMSSVRTIAALLDHGYCGPLILLVRDGEMIDRDDLPPIERMRFLDKPVSVRGLLRSVREELDASRRQSG